MSLDFRNVNLLWSSALLATLRRLGLRMAVVCPGSRSAPLAIAAAQAADQDPAFEAIPILDERSASFFALGQARRTGRAVALICSSGTAAANFYPAVIEASESGVPMLILSADRPPELRACHAGQAIDQVKLFGGYAQFTELALPEVQLLPYLRQTIAHNWQQGHGAKPRPIHINLPFREPLSPVLDPAILGLAAGFDLDRWLGHLSGWEIGMHGGETRTDVGRVAGTLAQPCRRHYAIRPYEVDGGRSVDRQLIIVGLQQPGDPEGWGRSIAVLAEQLQAPVLADSLNPIRHHASLNPNLVSCYDAILRNADCAQDLRADRVWCIGELPTSKVLRQWLSATDPELMFVDPSGDNLDPLHGRSIGVRLTAAELVELLQAKPISSQSTDNNYLDRWQDYDRLYRQFIDKTLDDRAELCEAKIPWMLSQCLPQNTPVFIANSTPIRDVEWFWAPGDRGARLYFNRGTNGIDGTFSTALGLAHGNTSTVLLTGDLALLHDSNGALIRPQLRGHLTIILVNNNGGGIFELLPIAQHDPPFETYFGTPQNIDFEQFCKTYAIDYQSIESWQHLQRSIAVLPESGIRLLEIRTDRKAEATWRMALFQTFAAGLNPPTA
jgi:2-succinyl-5-enolpyruvyl-6-hydroxy-3-cyclohexene-1-carboxylate synthase